MLAALRQRLAEKFPQAERRAAPGWQTGIEAIDELTGGLPAAALTEIVCDGASCGSQALLGALWHGVSERRGRTAWIDAHDRFDPASWPASWLPSLVWVRCNGGAAQAMQVADIMARDANLSLVLLDLRDASAAELRRIPAPFWYRLQHAVETTGQMLVTATPRAIVPSARLRLSLGHEHGLASLDASRFTLVNTLQPEVERQRLAVHASASA